MWRSSRVYVAALPDPTDAALSEAPRLGVGDPGDPGCALGDTLAAAASLRVAPVPMVCADRVAPRRCQREWTAGL